MGNALRKGASGESTIDGGSTFINTHLSTPSMVEYDPKEVKKLILARKLAPFYEGRANASRREATEDSNDDADSTSSLHSAENGGGKEGGGGGGEYGRRKGWSRLLARRQGKHRERSQCEQEALRLVVHQATEECPICFLYYPRNINKTRCCRQSLCTRCFVSLRRPPSGRVITCPFCNNRSFAVTYRPPLQIWYEEIAERRMSISFKMVPVNCESIRPYRPMPAPRPPASTQYRAATISHRYLPYSGPPFSVRYGTRTTTYGLPPPGGLFLYDRNGRPAAYMPGPLATGNRTGTYRAQEPGAVYRSMQWPGMAGHYYR